MVLFVSDIFVLLSLSTKYDLNLGFCRFDKDDLHWGSKRQVLH